MSELKTVVTVRFETMRPDALFFREVTLDGPTVRVFAATSSTGGKVTRVFERRGERFDDPAKATAAFERLLTEARKNFKKEQRLERQVPRREFGLSPVADNPSLEAGIRANRDDAADARVYADWLQSHGDLRGELAALFQSGKEEAARAWLDENADRVLGLHDQRLHDEVYDLEFTNGFLDQVSLRRSRAYARQQQTDLGELTAAVLALPFTSLLRRLRFGLASYESDNDWTSTMEAVASSKRASQLTTLRFDDYMSEDCELSWTAFGDFSAAWPRLPALEHLHVRSGEGGTLGELVLPRLKRFVRESGGLGDEELRAIVKARWPALEHLEVWTGREEYGAQATVERLQPLFDGEGTPALKSFGLVNCEFVHECLEPLARSRLLPRLTRLDLSKGALQDRDVDELLRHASAFAHLAELDLSENQLTDESLGRISEALPNAIVSEQQDLYDDEGHRYTAVGE